MSARFALLVLMLLPMLAFSQVRNRQAQQRSVPADSLELMPMAAPVTIIDSYAAQELVQDVLVSGSCAETSNFSISGNNSFGFFANSAPEFPFDEGIVLSTGDIQFADGPVSGINPQDPTAWFGDQDLEEALGISDSYNATVLEFDFTPSTGNMRFEYIFASKEYDGEFQCQFSDGFAFLLKPAGSDEPYQNLALIPETGIPVAVTTIHPEVPGACGAINSEFFNGYNTGAYPINFNGQTIVMTAQADVVPGTVYHIKIVIADQTDTLYQSAIFLKAKSFNIGLDLGDDRTGENTVCEGEDLLLDAEIQGTNTYQWYKNDVPLVGETMPQLSVSQPGVYMVEVTPFGSLCIFTDEITVDYSAPILLNNPVILVQCGEISENATFDLRKADPQLVAGGSVTYFVNQADAEADVDPIADPSAFNSPARQIIAKVVSLAGCTAYAIVNLQITDNMPPAPSPVVVCDAIGDQDGITSILLSETFTPLVTDGLPAGLLVEYYLSLDAAYSGVGALPDFFTNTVAFSQLLYVRLVNGPDCFGITQVQLIVDAFDVSQFQDESIILCDGASQTLQAPAGFSSYLWTTGQTTNTLAVTAPGMYPVTVTNTNGCTITKMFNVEASGIATNISVDVVDFSQEANSVTINFSGSGDYEFSIDGIIYQDDPYFSGLTPGEYAIYIRDKKGCGVSDPYVFFIMDYPKFFTPNGDGFNDYWRIKYSDREPGFSIAVFDRYGKLVSKFAGSDIGWDGQHDGQPLPSTDYWFVIVKPDGKERRGHFSLKR